MTLRSRLVVDRGAFRLDVPLEVADGEVVALLGPNGAGKSTALRALAGLVALSDGTIVLDGTEIATAGRGLPPERRGVGVVFQDYLLFPHLSALENVAFGPRCAGVPKAAAREQAAELLARMGLAEVASQQPARLSGGQAQRVALARALAISPRLLLLDEPLAALDAVTRITVRADLRRHLAAYGGATVLVTHDPLDAMVLADRIVVIEGGVVVQVGTPTEIVSRPRTDYVARLAGLNLYRGRAGVGSWAGEGDRTGDGDRAGAGGRVEGDRAEGGRVEGDRAGAGARVGEGRRVEIEGGGTLAVDEPVEGDVFVAFPPSAVAVFGSRPEGSPRNVWEVVVAGLEPRGDHVRVQFVGEPPVAAEVTALAAAELGLAPGRPAWVALKATETHAYPA